MKQIFILLCFVAFSATKIQARETPIPSVILHSFYAKFAEASNVSWEQADGFTVASFTFYGAKKYAYYNEANELIVTADPISADQLPGELEANLTNLLRHYTVTEIFRMQTANGTSYSAIVESAKRKLYLKSFADAWEVTKSVRK